MEDLTVLNPSTKKSTSATPAPVAQLGVQKKIAMVRPFLRIGPWAGNAPLGSPGFPFIRFCMLIVGCGVGGQRWLVQNVIFQKDSFGACRILCLTIVG